MITFDSDSNQRYPQMEINNTESNLRQFNGRVWNLYRHTLLPVYPPHIPVEIGKAECKALIRAFHPYFIRWTNGWDCPENTGFWYIIKERKEDLSEYPSKIRNTIRKGIRNFFARRIEKEYLKSNGYSVYIKAFGRYQTAGQPLTEAAFLTQMDQLFRTGEWEFWGVFENTSGTLAGYSMNWIYDHSCEYKTIKLDPFYLKESSSYLLIHEMNKHYLNEREFLYINDGARSLVHESNIQNYLEDKFLFRKAYCHLNVFYNPWVSLAVHALYPWKSLFYFSGKDSFIKIATLLKHEEIIRNYRGKNL